MPPVIHPSCPLPPTPTTGGDAGVGGCPAQVPNVCAGPAGNLYCTNLLYDNASCGACGVACPAGALCRDGRCASTDTGSGASVTFNDSGANAYSNSFAVNLSQASAGAITFNGNSRFGAFNLQASAMPVHNVLHDGEAQSRAATLAAALYIHAIEPLR